MTIEIWKPVLGREAEYEVSNCGRVRSLDRTIRQPIGKGHSTVYEMLKKGCLLKAGLASNGYYTVALGRGRTRTVHSLVAEAFLGPCPKGMDVMHLDGSRTNNNVSNLRYGTRTENILDAVQSGSWHSEKRKAAWRLRGAA